MRSKVSELFQKLHSRAEQLASDKYMTFICIAIVSLAKDMNDQASQHGTLHKELLSSKGIPFNEHDKNHFTKSDHRCRAMARRTALPGSILVTSVPVFHPAA
jgi:hypothetical protein